MIYTKYIGSDSHVVLPEQNENIPYTSIGTKAFLSCKEIKSLQLPSSITAIEDWAFAHMHGLTDLTIPAESIRFGKKVFLDCKSLQRIHIQPDLSCNPGLPFFLADIVTVFSQTNLLDPIRAASSASHASWMQEYDILLTNYLKSADDAGFEPVFYGWFNDEDADVSQRPEYINRQRTNKVRMTFTRLLHDLHLSKENRLTLQSYLRAHMPWGDQAQIHTAVWDKLPVSYADDLSVYPLLTEAGAITPDVIPMVMEHLSEADPEIRAWLLRYQEQHGKASDFFDSFSL